ncbi:MAG: hypothetical protein B7Y98_12480 [Sphingomonas sp. 32-62-10]|nr:MAG: hypothetical protein B7Z43_00645 [Sphingomonas sp. 12-62-6]OYX37402.1 MAG: hypothetical protein B7Y98_12480 [Sphingomonas sp. 32-62-10]
MEARRFVRPVNIALDSNILVYAAGVQRGTADIAKITRSRSILRDLANCALLVVPAQGLGELFNVLVRSGFDRAAARSTVSQIAATYQIAYSDAASFTGALDLATDYKLQFWDSLILSTAANAGCALLLSEDMQNGFTFRGVTIANPFFDPVHPALARLLNG